MAATTILGIVFGGLMLAYRRALFTRRRRRIRNAHELLELSEQVGDDGFTITINPDDDPSQSDTYIATAWARRDEMPWLRDNKPFGIEDKTPTGLDHPPTSQWLRTRYRGRQLVVGLCSVGLVVAMLVTFIGPIEGILRGALPLLAFGGVYLLYNLVNKNLTRDGDPSPESES